MKAQLLVISTLFLLLDCRAVFGYANFIAYGYRSCNTCHYNPQGGGPNTDYGRGVWATHIAAKPFYAKDATDEQLGQSSGFLGTVPFPHWFRLSADYRGLAMATNLESKARFRAFTMKADFSAVVSPFEDQRLIATATVGYIDDDRGSTNGYTPTVVSRSGIAREYYVGYRPSDSLGFYAGFMNLAYGLRIPDHIAYSRSRTFIGPNDQTHGITVHHSTKDYEVSLQAFVGNLLNDPSVRPKGAALMGEFEVGENKALGGSLLYSESTYRKRAMAAVHYRTRTAESNSLISELGVIMDNRKLMGDTDYGTYFFAQYHHPLVRGLIFLPSVEFYTPRTFTSAAKQIRLGPSIQWFPMQRVEMRLDVSATFQFAPQADSTRLNAFGQVHLAL